MKKESFLSSPEHYRVQKTLSKRVEFDGIGLHSGKPARLSLCPAKANHGIVFVRTDIDDTALIPAHYDHIVSTSLATSLGLKDRKDIVVHTVEHIMSAIYAMGITNLRVELTGPEVPILDGSAAPFLERFFDVGVTFQNFTAPILKILKPIKVHQEGAIAELLPRDHLRLTTSIDFPHPSIGMQMFALELTSTAFRETVANSRTFGFLRDLEKLRSHNLALGASLENVLAFSDDGILNPEGRRHEDECVRHKLLDAIGDLALCGSWIEGEMVSFRGGHKIHLTLLKALREHRSYWEFQSPKPLSGKFLLKEPTTIAAPLWQFQSI